MREWNGPVGKSIWPASVLAAADDDLNRRAAPAEIGQDSLDLRHGGR
jgi:hypothetical protein